MSDRDTRMVEEFLAGTEVPAIAARYDVPEDYVDRVIEETHLNKPKRRSWGMDNWGNRLVYSILAGFAVNLSTGIHALGTSVTVVLFVLTTAIVSVRRR